MSHIVRSLWHGNEMVAFRPDPNMDTDEKENRGKVNKFGRAKAVALLVAIHKDGIETVIAALAEVAGLDDAGKINLEGKEGAAADLTSIFG